MSECARNADNEAYVLGGVTAWIMIHPEATRVRLHQLNGHSVECALT